MFSLILMSVISSGWAVQVDKDMLSDRPTALAVIQENGARIGIYCDADTNYETAIVVQRQERSALPRIGSTYVTYRFDEDRERHAHWQNANSDSVSIKGSVEKKSFLAAIKTKTELKFRARTYNLTSVDMKFNLSVNREKLTEFFSICRQ